MLSLLHEWTGEDEKPGVVQVSMFVIINQMLAR